MRLRSIEPTPGELALARRGRQITQLPDGNMDFGCGQLIHRLEDGYAVASDAWRESLAAGF